MYDPFVGAMKLVPVAVYGAVPPDAEYEQVKGLPAVNPDGQVTVTTSGCADIVTLVDPVADTPFASVAEKDSVKVPLTG